VVFGRPPASPHPSPLPFRWGEGVAEPRMFPLAPCERGEGWGEGRGRPFERSVKNFSNCNGNPEQRSAHLGGLPCENPGQQSNFRKFS
jgi:hypothetical protein